MRFPLASPENDAIPLGTFIMHCFALASEHGEYKLEPVAPLVLPRLLESVRDSVDLEL